MGFAMLATRRYKLVVHEESREPCQLFDLDSDPLEDMNLVQDRGHGKVLQELLQGYALPFLDAGRTPAGASRD
jgi:hypothetical protein